MKPLPLLLIILCIFTSTAPLHAQNQLLGKVDFPNSGSAAAQDDFMEGVLFLHNFEYEDAARAFRRAQQKDPDFALAYYGEAKTHNHPIWMQQDQDAAMEVLKRLAPTVAGRQAKAPTQREKDYLMSLEVLYGNTAESRGKSKEERDVLYRDAMKQLHEKYPEDHEITTYYGLSILGTAHEGRDYAIYMKAAAELFQVWNENQQHPGAAHYLIHSFDDPVHAPLGLPMAKAYAEIAPAAAHAQHMTSHIFLALGMWDDVIEANIVARDVQTSRQEELDEQPTVCGHYPWWLEYGYLQTGETREAREVLDTCSERITPSASNGEKWHYAVMRGHLITDTKDWDLSWQMDTEYQYDANSPGARNFFFASGYASVQNGNLSEAKEHLDELNNTADEVEKDIQVKQLQGLIALEEGNHQEGMKLLQEAVATELSLPIDFGPPVIVKPSLELLGDVLLEQKNYQQALDVYEQQLERTPKRKLSIAGREEAEKML
ncbi:tetratricopeptide repeat protein [Gracilimonas mengyeensis]|uniref:Tetratricopeptide repeat-containing protein n=1 Tax=Gracilimonas mengyeensis TaxID=1302730 RepID=A0A521EHI2_9BACT|nr:tetratricopeptide repeat protein [Gracilimonas mengyeensis]SMO83355.1 Tetratricopeptide repeat-containing protein [Gracilimonas mengyeensis]